MNKIQEEFEKRARESIIEELENCFEGHDEYILGLLAELKTSRDAEIEELKEECQGELKGMEIAFDIKQAEIEELRECIADIKQEEINKLKERYLRVRDALILGYTEEAYHTLYEMADPEFKSNHPWKEWEALKDGK